MTHSPVTTLIALTLLLITACSGSGLASNRLVFSDASCAPNLVVVADPVNNRSDAYDLPAGCTADGTHRRQFRVPSPADGEFTLHLYNATPYATYTRVFGMKRGQRTNLVLDCRKDAAAYQSTTITKAKGYDFLVVDISYGVNGQYGPITNANTLALAAYDNITDRRGSIGTRSLSCDGLTTDEVVLSTCDRSVNLADWAKELGLEVVQELNRNGTSVVAKAPGRMLVNSTGVPPTKTREPMKQDSSQVSFEENFIITLPTYYDPNSLTEAQQEELGIYPDLAQNCMQYAPKTRFASQRRPIVAAIIDSGVEMNGAWSKDFQRFGPQGLPGIRRGSLGFDFINNDDTPEDNVGHGTSVAGTLIGQYTGDLPLQVIHLKVFDDKGRATYAGTVEAIYIATDAGANIINLSWGIPQDEAPEALRCALDYAQDKGAVIITTAGNETINTDRKPQWPGAFSLKKYGFDRLFTVGSFRYLGTSPELQNARPAIFTNYGNQTVDGYAYMTAPMPIFGQQKIGYLFGTSFSAPLLGARWATELSRGRRWDAFPKVLAQGSPFRSANSRGTEYKLSLLEVECKGRP